MLVARSLDEVPHNPRTIVTIGTFDGVHLGHARIIEQVVEKARSGEARAVVVTFDPHPREVVGRGPLKMLTTIDERTTLLREFGIDIVLVVGFTFEFSRQSAREFYETYIMRGIGVEEVIVGHDHMFGRDREAGVEELKKIGKELGFAVFQEPPLTVDGEVVNSSKIREALLRGDVQKASRWLGRAYSIFGKVVRGDGRGSTLGFPTANIEISDPRKLVPAEGVYFVEVEHAGRRFFGMLSVGVNPTFKTDGRRTIEVHVFDFSGSVYGEALGVRFLRRLRGEEKFSSREALIEQMERDREQCLKLIEELEQIR